MKKFNVILILISIMVAGCTPSASTTSNPKPDIIPAIKEWSPGKGAFQITAGTAIDWTGGDLVSRENLHRGLYTLTGIELEKHDGAKSDVNNFVFNLSAEDTRLGTEGYRIVIDKDVEIYANNEKGLFYATQTILQILTQGKDHRELPKGEIIDYPEVATRAFMIDAGRKYFEMNYLKKTIRNMAWYKLNTLHMHFTDWNGFRLQSDKFPTLPSEQAYSKADIRELQDYAKKHQILIVPEIDMPAHATHILLWNKSFNFNCDAMLTAPTNWLPQEFNDARSGWILNVTDPKVQDFIVELFNEFIPLFDSPYIHIGGDEWQYDHQKWACPELVEYMEAAGYQYPGDVFVEWINNMNALVKSHGKRTQIWSWWNYSPVPERQNITSIQPDKDIIVNVWNKEAKEQILKDGYEVIITLEDGPEALYITPGLGGKAPGDYGYFDSENIYRNWTPETTNDNILGYKVCMWSDRAEHQSDEWFDQFSDIPKAVFSSKVWGTNQSMTYEEFLVRHKHIGHAP